jgi:predicted RecA/RadA family phage recombinase
MLNFKQLGDQVTVIAPAGGTVSGVGVLVGSLFGVATKTAAVGTSVEIRIEGVCEIAKTSALAISTGDRLYWDNAAKVVNKTAAAQICVGVAVSDAVNPSPTVWMKLNMCPITAAA